MIFQCAQHVVHLFAMYSKCLKMSNMLTQYTHWTYSRNIFGTSVATMLNVIGDHMLDTCWGYIPDVPQMWLVDTLGKNDPEPAMYPRCSHWFPGHLAPSVSTPSNTYLPAQIVSASTASSTLLLETFSLMVLLMLTLPPMPLTKSPSAATPSWSPAVHSPGPAKSNSQ